METKSLSNPLDQSANLLTSTSLSGEANFLANSSPLTISNSSAFRSSSSSGSSSLGGNIIIGNGEWVIKGIEQDKFASLTEKTLDSFTSTIFDRLNDKYISENGDKLTGSGVSNENPFANGNNPFGEGNMPALPALDLLKSQYGENFPLPSGDASNAVGGTDNSNPSTDNISSIGLAGDDNIVVTGDGSENPSESSATPAIDDSNTVAIAQVNPEFIPANSDNQNAGNSDPFANGSSGEDNPFANGGSSEGNPFDNGGSSEGNPFATGGSGEGNPLPGATSSFDITSILGDTSTGSDKETLSKVLDFTTNFAGSLDSIGSNIPFGNVSSNESPFETPSDLLRLFRSDMASFGLTVDSFTNFTGENNPFAGSDNPFAGTNPFANNEGEGGLAEQEGRLIKFLGWALDGLLPFTGRPNVFQTPEGELPLGYGNRDFGSGNATIGNANRDYGSNNGSIGNNNWNWDSSTNNASIGNGNFNFGSYNKTVGNGNWTLDHSSDNNTFGNGNWNIGSDNSTLGNGNFNFGSNNLVIGNGNRVFTSNSIVIGNGNWSVVMENTASNLVNISSILEKMDTFALGSEIKGVVDDLVGTTVRKMGNLFSGLTEDFDDSQKQTFDNVICEKDTYSLENPFASLASV
jgi:hypothetical protein